MTDSRMLAEADLDYLRSVDSPTIANALERLDLRDRSDGYIGGSVQCAFPELGVMVGTALTVTVDNAVGRTARQEGYWALWEALEQSTGPTVIVMKDASGTPERVAYAGEIMVTLASRLGAIGIVTDGALRDVAEVRARGFHYFMRYPVVSHANFELSKVGDPVHLDGQLVHTGDILHGDVNGVVIVPWESLPSIRDAVSGIQAAERRDLDYIDGPDFSLEGYKQIRGYGR
ncbi:RraA family protein [Salinibacterium soli]|uniref:Putative 4-hydroxy-4-methyl-2-oxoglutarate aldolase n=1 Tax=Antiquaquibacter soli TaxID=3064523 RepID=A0ABT9BPX3_9MICO|nr:RraA family protein [Protaetiibacter sp. WY-16]MDO7883096.1 RraA family protein [Protaetiibacter sp. WY-16]